MVPRVLSDLFWLGRYGERAEDLLRLILATRTVAIETDLDTTSGRALRGAAAGRHARQHDLSRDSSPRVGPSPVR